MSPQASARGRLSRGADSLADRADALRRALETGEGRLPEAVLAPAREALALATERVNLSAEHTVVALAGATGAGKSSLFNELAGAELARTGRVRPTTSHALAVVCEGEGPDAGALLEWLGVPERVDVAVGARHPAGLVLLDLPDHDSVVAEHRLRADHVTQRADLVVWVTNPQKYADAVLHARYLAPLAGHEGSVLVVLNQVDRLTPAQASECARDLARLVREDGLRARVLATSALTGEGVGALGDVVIEAAERRRAATERLHARLRGAARELLAVLPPEPAGGSPVRADALAAARAELVAALEQASGVDLVVAAVEASALRDAAGTAGWPPTRWVRRLRADPLRTLGLRPDIPVLRGRGRARLDEASRVEPTSAALAAAPRRSSLPTASPAARARVASAARAYVGAATDRLPGAWGEALNARVVGSVAGVADALDVAVVRSVPLPRPRWWTLAGWAQWLLLATCLVGLGWLGVLAAWQYAAMPRPYVPVLTTGTLEWPWPTVLAVGGGLLGVLLSLVARLLARTHARRRARTVRARLRREVSAVAGEQLFDAVDSELAALDALRASARRAAA